MKNIKFAFFIAGFAFSGLLFGQKWAIQNVPLYTPWSEMIEKSNVLAEYPRPIMEREDWQNLNGIWQFQEAKEGDPVPIGKKLKEEILVPFPWESAISGIRRQLPHYRAWYRRTFTVPKQWGDKSILLNFGAVDWESTVYINGRCVALHRGGYDAFSVDITHFLSAKNTNEIIVGVYDPGSDEKHISRGKQANERFADPQRYSYCPSSGIWQTVWIEPVSELHVEDLFLTPDVDNQLLKVVVYANTVTTKGEWVEVAVKNGTTLVGQSVGVLSEPFCVEVPDAQLWSPESPFLYDVEIILRDSSKVLDKVRSYMGMRKVALAKNAKGYQEIHLNNAFLFQMGPLDQGYWPDGIYTAPTDEALKWDIAQMKEFGFNMVRKHIKVEPQRWYYWADKLGLLVWQDMPSTFGTRTNTEQIIFETELNTMVRSHYNHPCIVNWIVFNEHWGLYDPVRLTNFVMDLDPSRLVTGNSGIDAGKPNIDFEVGHIKDNHSYRPPSVPFVTQKRASVNGEYGAIGYNVAGHIWDEDGPWVHNNYANADSATLEYEKFVKMILQFQNEGLSGAVYTQWTDVENEMNGIYTYDRKVIKLDKHRVSSANKSTWEKRAK